MEQFIYTNSRGDSITIAYNSEYILKEYDGITAAEIIPISTSGYMQNGASFIANKLGTRMISIGFLTHANTMHGFYEKRKHIGKVFNPTIGQGKLTYTNDYLSKSIDVVVSASPTPFEKMGSLQLIRVEFIAHNPLWYDNEVSALKLGDFTGGLTYPLHFETSETFAQKGDAANIIINGDVPSPITVEFRDNSLNPKLSLLNTGEFLEVDTEILDNEKIIINTAYGNKTVTHTNSSGVETSAYNLITTDSTFFSLPIGENKLTFAGDAGSPEVYLYWRNWFIGV